MTGVPALGRPSQAQVPRARSGTRPGPPTPQICNFLSPRSFPIACRHDGTASPPYPRRYLSVAPLQSLQRCDGEVTVRLRRGQPQDRERARLPRSVGAQTSGLPYQEVLRVNAATGGKVPQGQTLGPHLPNAGTLFPRPAVPPRRTGQPSTLAASSAPRNVPPISL
jgi:hypothetical protein